jgi:hypothetical protein
LNSAKYIKSDHLSKTERGAEKIQRGNPNKDNNKRENKHLKTKDLQTKTPPTTTGEDNLRGPKSIHKTYTVPFLIYTGSTSNSTPLYPQLSPSERKIRKQK